MNRFEKQIFWACVTIYVLLGLVFAFIYVIIVPPLILMFWAKPKPQDDRTTMIDDYKFLCLGAFVGFYLLVVLLVVKI
jgi:hypothetical protein